MHTKSGRECDALLQKTTGPVGHSSVRIQWPGVVVVVVVVKSQKQNEGPISRDYRGFVLVCVFLGFLAKGEPPALPSAEHEVRSIGIVVRFPLPLAPSPGASAEQQIHKVQRIRRNQGVLPTRSSVPHGFPNDVPRSERGFVRAQRGARLPRERFSRPWLISTAEARTSNSPSYHHQQHGARCPKRSEKSRFGRMLVWLVPPR